ncbi:hypothetical protein K523DRAFT_320727 [Schizophyllum commune Tattone D]|nr:hypothetical protein K523DRAFT_320727 [Schizophyllum commune Tattone D]
MYQVASQAIQLAVISSPSLALVAGPPSYYGACFDLPPSRFDPPQAALPSPHRAALTHRTSPSRERPLAPRALQPNDSPPVPCFLPSVLRPR